MSQPDCVSPRPLCEQGSGHLPPPHPTPLPRLRFLQLSIPFGGASRGSSAPGQRPHPGTVSHLFKEHERGLVPWGPPGHRGTLSALRLCPHTCSEGADRPTQWAFQCARLCSDIPGVGSGWAEGGRRLCREEIPVCICGFWGACFLPPQAGQRDPQHSTRGWAALWGCCAQEMAELTHSAEHPISSRHLMN